MDLLSYVYIIYCGFKIRDKISVVSLTEIITNVDEVDLIMFNSISKSNTKKQ